MAQRAVQVRCGQRERPRHGARLPVLLSQRQRGLAIGRHSSREGQSGEAAWREPDALPEADDWIEGGADGIGQRAPVERLRIVGAASAAEEPQAIGFAFKRALR
jgi:hypothetical protein